MIEENRKQKLSKLLELNIDPYPAKYNYTHTISEVKEKYDNLTAGQHTDDLLKVAGRVILVRQMGKATFFNISDWTGKLQIYIRKDIVGEQNYINFLELVDIGDFVGISGIPFKTKTSELSINTSNWQFLSKALRTLPEKWHGLKDIEIRYRQRYLDLIANENIKKNFYTRSKIIDAIRKYLNEKNFLEVETPIIQNLAGGALAKPFKTHHNVYDIDLFLRIAPELFLKMLVVGGIEKVYELAKNFRNEGIDRRHNPEFTMLEIYQAYSDYNDMLILCKDLFEYITKTLNIDQKINYGDYQINLFDFNSITLKQLSEDVIGENIIDALHQNRIKKLAEKLNFQLEQNIPDRKIFDRIFEHFLQPKLINPTFVLDYPVSISPLAKTKKDNSLIAERFELFIAGEEIANAYSELNDPQEQKKRFKTNLDQNQTDEEIHLLDENFITALEYGMPPCAGLGIGIDRLTMILNNCQSIREVILFPLLKPE